MWWLIYPVLGACAGLLAGLLGVGGGLVIVAALAWLLPLQGVPAEQVMQVALATSLGSIIFTGLSSARSHQRRGSVLWPSVWRLVPGLLIGAALGSHFATTLSSETLRYVVAGFCLLAGSQLAFGTPRPALASFIAGRAGVADADFPVDLLPPETGLILADPYDAEVVRMAPETPLSGARRKVVLRTFARAAAGRLQLMRDPGAGV